MHLLCIRGLLFPMLFGLLASQLHSLDKATYLLQLPLGERSCIFLQGCRGKTAAFQVL